MFLTANRPVHLKVYKLTRFGVRYEGFEDAGCRRIGFDTFDCSCGSRICGLGADRLWFGGHTSGLGCRLRHVALQALRCELSVTDLFDLKVVAVNYSAYE